MDAIGLKLFVLLLILCVYSGRSQTPFPIRPGTRDRDSISRSRIANPAMPTRLSRAQGVPGMSLTQGVSGVARAQGAPGMSLTQGFSGVARAQGVPGMSLTQGVSGEARAQGVPGMSLTQGFSGVARAQGVPGMSLTQGVSGVAGAQVVPGMSRAQGVTGLSRVQGVPGMSRSQEIPGMSRAQVPGMSRDLGVPGMPRAQGVPGMSRTQGVSGVARVQVVPGMPRAQGVSGVARAQVFPGMSRAQGVTGVARTQVVPGMSRAQGISGVARAQVIPGMSRAQGVLRVSRAQGVPGMPRSQGVPGMSRTQGVFGGARAQGVPGMSRAQGVPRIQAPRVPVTSSRVPINIRQSGPARTRIGQMSPVTGRSRDTRGLASIARRGRPTGPALRDPRFRTPPRMLPRLGPPARVTRRPRPRPSLMPVNRPSCRRSTVAVCRAIPRGQNVRARTTACYRNCPGRPCIVQCVCACVTGNRRMDPRSRLMQGLQSRLRNRGSLRSQNALQLQRPGLRGRMQRPNNISRRSDLTFGISESALAAILSNPDVSSLVGPQGINDILAGVPPPIISGADPVPSGLVPGLRPAGQEPPPTDMGIPIPLPGTRPEPQLGSDMLLASILADSVDLREMTGLTGLKTRENVPAVRSARVPALDLLMPSATIDNSVLVQSASGNNNGTSPLTSGSGNSTIVALNANNGPGMIVPTTTGSLSSLSQGQTFPDMRQFLTGTVKATDPKMSGPSKEECLTRQLELWCDPVGVWGETPGVARWCILNCRAETCDRKRCSCSCIDEMLFKQRYEQVGLQTP